MIAEWWGMRPSARQSTSPIVRSDIPSREAILEWRDTSYTLPVKFCFFVEAVGNKIVAFLQS